MKDIIDFVYKDQEHMLPEPLAIFTSSDFKENKGHLLFPIVLEHLPYGASDLLHIGDNSESDINGAKMSQISSIHYAMDAPMDSEHRTTSHVGGERNIMDIIRAKISASENQKGLRRFFYKIYRKFYHRRAIKICSKSMYFDANWYLTQYPDVKEAGINPIHHYIRHGVNECRDPGPNFSTLIYLVEHPNLIKSGLNPLVHQYKNNRSKKSVIVNHSYKNWIALYDTLTDQDRNIIHTQIKNLPHKPLISVIMPVYNTPSQWLMLAIESVIKQLYPYWELCIADDASTDPEIKTILENYRRNDPRIKVIFRTENGHISAASNSALSLATGDFISLLDHDDELAEHALFKVAEEINAHPNAVLIYSDEDKIDTYGVRSGPYFKSDWNPDLLYGHNFISHLGTYKRSVIHAIGGFRLSYEGSQDYDLALRVIETVKADQIRHIPHVLYHWRMIPGSIALNNDQKNYAHDAARKAIQSHLNRIGMREAKVEPHPIIPTFHRVVYPLPKMLPLVSIIIPTKDKVHLLKQCVRSILTKTDYPAFEILIIDNQSVSRKTFKYYKELEDNHKIKILFFNEPFNYSKMNNFAVEKANGELITLLNNDTEVISTNWLKEMVQHAIRPEIGIVGAKLYYPDNTIQHAGVIAGFGGVAGHLYSKCKNKSHGQAGKAVLTQNFLTVTAACITLRRSVFQEIGGFEENNLVVAFNDVDLCFRIYKKGYRVLWTPFAELYHHESATRGGPKSSKQKEQSLKETQYMREHWLDLIKKDPFYNPNLSLDKKDCSLAFPPRT